MGENMGKNKILLRFLLLLLSVFTILGTSSVVYEVQQNYLKTFLKQTKQDNIPFEIPEDVPSYPNMIWDGVGYRHGYDTSIATYWYNSPDKITDVVDFYSKNLSGKYCGLEKVIIEEEPLSGWVVFIYRCGKNRYYIAISNNKNKTYISISETHVFQQMMADTSTE
jgi:hypothetical protein